MNLNKAIIVGRLTADPELKTLESGMLMTSFSMATNTYYTDKVGEKKETVEFHNIIIFGKMAETSAKFLKKGQLALAEGRIQTRSWAKDDGTKGYRTQIVVDRLQFGPKASGLSETAPNEQNGTVEESSGPKDKDASKAPKSSGGKTSASKKQYSTGPQVEYPSEEINPDDIPF